MIKQGSKDKELNKAIQEEVGATPDGIFGPATTKLVIAYQRKHHLIADGIVGPKTLEMMGLLDTDIEAQHYTTSSGLVVHKHFLPKGEYIEGPIKNEYAFIHHTAGWNNPYKTIDSWGRDDRGRIATEFVLGGQRITDGDKSYDGIMCQAFPEGCQGWHLGKTGSRHMNRHSVALEICAFGYLKNGKTYVGGSAHRKQIALSSFRGYRHWHKYSDAQIEATRKWILWIAERDNIDMSQGLIKWIKEDPATAFDFKQEAYEGKVKGLLTHTNVRKDKTDNFPQASLIEMLKTI